MFQNSLSLGQAPTITKIMPYTLSTNELDSLSGKLQIAEQQISSMYPKHVESIIPFSLDEIHALQMMLEMTYLQGFSSAGGLLSSSMNTKSIDNTNNPPTNYACHKCGNQGHYVHDCPDLINKGAPPKNYICHKCNIQGHWIQECPLGNQQDHSKPPPPGYCCHRCGVPGHWIKNCPTNNDSLENPTRNQTNGTFNKLKNNDASSYVQQWNPQSLIAPINNTDDRDLNSRMIATQGVTYVKKKSSLE